LSPDVDEIVEQQFPGRDLDVEAMRQLLASDPRRALVDENIVKLILAGGFRSPTFDTATVRSLAAILDPRVLRPQYHVELRLVPAGA
jgi:hypothetical protein